MALRMSPTSKRDKERLRQLQLKEAEKHCLLPFYLDFIS
jgi:hypothetical protein